MAWHRRSEMDTRNRTHNIPHLYKIILELSYEGNRDLGIESGERLVSQYYFRTRWAQQDPERKQMQNGQPRIFSLKWNNLRTTLNGKFALGGVYEKTSRVLLD